MRQVILASLRTYARRYVAAIVAVVIATGFIVGINAMAGAAREGAAASVSAQYVGADVVASMALDDVDYATLAARAVADPDVTATATNWVGYTSVRWADGTSIDTIGSIAGAEELQWQQVGDGRLPRSADEAAVSSGRADRHGVAVGDTVSIDSDLDGGAREVTVTGLIDDDDGPLSASVYLPETSFGAFAEVAFPIDVVSAVDADATAVASRLAADAGDATVQTAESYMTDLRLEATQGVDIFQQLILVFAGISMFVGALVIANTFTILLAQRSRDLALLRCVGAVRSQIGRSVALEALVVGAVGSVIGVALGFGIAVAGVAALAAWSPGTPMGTPTLSAAGLLVPVGIGVAVTMAASWLPARRAGAQSPLAALQPQTPVELRTRAGFARLASATLLVLVGAAGLVVGAQGSLPVGMLGGMLSFVGVLLMTPVLVPAAIRLLGRVARLGGVPGRLALSNSTRNPRRTAATSTALLIGVTLITAVVVGTASIQEKVTTSLDANAPLDLTVSSSSGPLAPGTLERLEEVRGIERAVALPGAEAQVDDEDVTVLGVDEAALALGHGDEWPRTLATDEIALPASSTVFDDGGSAPTVRLSIGGEVRELTARYVPGTGAMPLVSTSTLGSMGADTSAASVWVRASDGSDAGDVTADVTAIAQEAGLDVFGGLPDRAEILELLGIVLAVTVGLLAIAVLIALVGVGNTLSLSVLERVRENSLLRAIGLPRSGLRAMLGVEALLMAGVSAVLGVALGMTYAWFGVRTLSHDVFDTPAALAVPWWQVLAILLVAAAAGLLACVLPARRAARIAPAAGLVAD